MKRIQTIILTLALPLLAGAAEIEVRHCSSACAIRPRVAADLAVTRPADRGKVRLARNETESVQLVVRAHGAERLEDVTVSCGKLEGAARPPVVTASPVGYVHVTNAPPYKVGPDLRTAEPGWWPDPILDFPLRVDVAPGDAQAFFVRVRAEAATSPGEYRGEITVSARGVRAVRVPLVVRVDSFVLPAASPLPLALTYSPHAGLQNPKPKAIEEERRAVERDPLSPINAVRARTREWGDFLSGYYLSLDALYRSDVPDMEHFAKLRREGRLGRFNLGYWNFCKEKGEAAERAWRERTLPPLRAAYDAASKAGLLDHAYLYGCDEVVPEHFEAIRRAARTLKSEFPGVPLMTTADDRSYGVDSHLDDLDAFVPLVQNYAPEKVAVARAAGHQVWWYVCCNHVDRHPNVFIECPPIETRLLMGALAQKYRPDGFLYYQISIWNSRRPIVSGPFTDWNPESWEFHHGDGALTCVGPDGRPLPTLRLENFRDGLEDLAYARLLEGRLARHPDAKDDWSVRARELLAVPPAVAQSLTNFTYDASVLLSWREAMADALESR